MNTVRRTLAVVNQRGLRTAAYPSGRIRRTLLERDRVLSASVTNSAPSRARPGAAALRSWAIGLAVFAGTVYVPLWSLLQRGVEAPFRYFAADAFYYLAIAHNSMGRPFYTYDGVRPTNGFNPLWEYYLSAVFAAARLDQPGQLIVALLSSTVFAGLGLALLAIALGSIVRRSVLIVLSLVPGFYYLLLAPLDPHFGAPWSFVNGMESGLSILWFGVLSYLMLGHGLLDRLTTSRIAVASALVTTITLCRLDDIFLFIPLFALLWLRSTTHSEWVRGSLLAAAIPTIAIGSYLLYNYSYSGMVLPISGVAKSYGLLNPVAWQNTLAEFAAVMRPPQPDRTAWTWSGGAWRAAQLTVPVACALLFLRSGTTHEKRSWRSRLRTLDGPRLWMVLLAALYIPAKAGYNFIYVHLWDQGHWYFPLSILLTNSMLLLLIDGAFLGHEDRRGLVPTNRLHAFAVRATAGVFVILWGNAFVQLKHYGAYGADFHHFWNERKTITAVLDAAGPGDILEFDDGIVAYSLSRPTQSGMALAGDRDLLASSRAGTMLDLAYERGARYLASVWYIQDWPDAAFADDAALRAAVQRLASQRDLEPWTFTLVAGHRTHNRQYVLVQFGPAAAGRGPR